MYFKTAVVLLWFVTSYLALVFVAANWWQALLSSVLALATAAVGFNVQHDANHGAFSKSRRVNHVVGLTLDMLGASSYVWNSKHNIFHHTCTNVEGSDSDIDLGPLARFAPAQRRRRLHAFQHYYLWDSTGSGFQCCTFSMTSAASRQAGLLAINFRDHEAGPWSK